MKIYAAIAGEWKRLYEEEELTIEQISLAYDVNINTVQRWLKKTNTKMRDPGHKPGKQRNDITKPGNSSQPDGPMRVPKTTARLGHRRRRRY